MSCSEAESGIHSYLDGELDLARSLEVERHLKGCTSCAGAYEGYRALRSAINRGSLYYGAPAGMQKRIRANVRRASRAEGGAPGLRLSWKALWVPLTAACLVLLGALPFLLRPAPQSLLAQEIVAAHVRSLMPGHLTDVLSSDQHTVKPWFNGRLDFSPPVVDLANHAFPLVGGRMDYVGDRTVAALVYQRRKHLINLFIWPAPPGAAAREESEAHNGYHMIRWTKSGMNYCAVSDVNTTDLSQFVSLVRGPA